MLSHTSATARKQSKLYCITEDKHGFQIYLWVVRRSSKEGTASLRMSSRFRLQHNRKSRAPHLLHRAFSAR
jgi:hypothetical protein